ncbi:MAG TPA: ThuA domain-containing protein [Vicinamibacterales bacterium]|nr:ThuA domain-containing protein [Vicinamibacterales bacterium]
MKLPISLLASAALVCTTVMAQQPAAPQGAPPPAAGAAQTAPSGPPIRVYIQGGLKTHAEGQHDYPQFLADWSKLLTSRGAIVDGSLHFPSARELANADVLVIYKGDAGYLSMEDRATLDNFLRRGGGVVSLHDALCGPDPEQFAAIVGGGKKHGEVNYTLEADVPYTIADPAHPIMQGMSNFTIKDEAFFNMTWSKSPEIHVLATAVMAKTPSAGTHAGEVVPQVWTYENRLLPGAPPFRAFVWMQGHNYVNFSQPQVQAMLLRGISWAANRPADALATERPQGRGGRGRGGRGGV